MEILILILPGLVCSQQVSCTLYEDWMKGIKDCSRLSLILQAYYCKYQQKGLLSRNWLTKSFSWVHLRLLCCSFGLRQHMILSTAHICAEHWVQIFKGTSSTWEGSSGQPCNCYYIKLKVLEWKGYMYTSIFSCTFCTL